MNHRYIEYCRYIKSTPEKESTRSDTEAAMQEYIEWVGLMTRMYFKKHPEFYPVITNQAHFSAFITEYVDGHLQGVTHENHCK